jgi:hypothetical protein
MPKKRLSGQERRRERSIEADQAKRLDIEVRSPRK